MAEVSVDKNALIEGERPMFNASYGKLMMWFFLVSDAFTFSSLLISYGALRIRSVVDSSLQAWANPEAVFTHFPLAYEIWHLEWPLVFVGIMTFILILSSVTMVLAVEAGHRKSKKEVQKWVLYTMLGGATFLGCQAYEWYHFIHGHENSAVAIPVSQAEALNIDPELAIIPHSSGHGDTHGAASHADGHGAHEDSHATTHSEEAVIPALYMNNVAGELIGFRLKDGTKITDKKQMDAIAKLGEATDSHGNHLHRTAGGANLKANEYGPQAFADLFFFVTGFHGTHVFSGVILLLILYINVVKGTYDRRGHYEMVEKIGLYWHFVDLVWVFVFTFFYLV